MHDIILIEFFKGLKKLPEDDEGFFFFEHFTFLKERFESTSVAVLIDEVEVVRCLKSFDEANDVFILEGWEDVDLIDGELF